MIYYHIIIYNIILFLWADWLPKLLEEFEHLPWFHKKTKNNLSPLFVLYLKQIVNFLVRFFRFCEIGVRGLKSSSHPKVATKTCQYHNVLSIFRYSIWANSYTIWFHWTVTSFPLLSHGYFYMMYWIIHDVCSNS